MTVETKTSYDLSHSTMGLEATEIDGFKGTIVYEKGMEPSWVAISPGKLIDQAIRYYGEELIARFDSAKILCGYHNKSPIAVSALNSYYFFPTHSPSNKNCSWFSHTHVKKITKAKFGSSTITFTDGQKVTLPVSEGTMINQQERTAQYRVSLEEQLKPIRQQGAIQAFIKLLNLEENDLTIKD